MIKKKKKKKKGMSREGTYVVMCDVFGSFFSSLQRQQAAGSVCSAKAPSILSVQCFAVLRVYACDVCVVRSCLNARSPLKGGP